MVSPSLLPLGSDISLILVDLSGDFFLHFLDSSEQALLVIPIFSQILPSGGGAYIAPRSIASIARHLANHPEGLLPGPGEGDQKFDFTARLKECEGNFVELTGDVGDVILMPSLMLHSAPASKNALRTPLKEPFSFNWSNPDDFSLVELKTLRTLGRDRSDFKLTVPRQRIVPARLTGEAKMRKDQLARLRVNANRNGISVPEICVQSLVMFSAIDVALRPRKTKEFSPKAFIINFGSPETEGKIVPPEELDNWHCDGDFFLHFLDSPEQSLLVIPIFSQILPSGGGAYIAPRSIASIARHLANHPEGLLPGPGEGDQKFDFTARLKECEGNFVELTGDVGDVILMPSLMLHSAPASKNALRTPLKEPFSFNWSNSDDFSLVELKTLRALRRDRSDFKLTVPRQRIVPARLTGEAKMRKDQLARLRVNANRNGISVPEICVQ